MEIVVHRGANSSAPENTMSAARACERLGVAYVEIDVRRSIDGVFYVLHDRTLDRTTNGHGAIAMRTSAYIDRLDAGSWFSAEFAGEAVPQLCQVLDWAKGRMGIYLDVKCRGLRKIVRMIRNREMEKDVFFWFESNREARRLRRLSTEASLKMNSRDAGQVRVHRETYGNDIVEYGPGSESESIITVCHELGIRCMATAFLESGISHADREAAYNRILELGYDLVNLDQPEPFIGFLQSRGLR